MDLETLLPAIRSLQDLPALVAALGHQPLWEEVPAEIRRGTKAGAPKITVVGRTGDLPWFAFESSSAEPAAEKLARRLSNRGRVCLVLALDLVTRRLDLAVGLNGCPTLQLDLDKPGSEALASLIRLIATSDGGALAFAVRAADALNAEVVGRRFFREFRATLESLAAGFPGLMRPEDRHSLALLQLTRVLFLYFIQTKGWLGGRKQFLAEEVDRCLRRGRRIHRDLLRPLFFGTLNRPGEARSRAATAFGSIPFLNGGLFEPHALERRFQADIPNNLWRDAFDRLFERFHFTVAEGERHGGVAPDMLGRVFEGVMTPEARHLSGTFYTPASLVGSVLDAALTALLASRLGCTEAAAERRLNDPDPEVAGVLATLSLLDPAVGSGAFLLGALDRLSSLGSGGTTSERRRRVLQQNLFGVDQSGAAVRLTELRLWLSVIADDPADHARQVAPLPNLDCLIRQGDSLFDPIDEGVGASPQGSELVTELSALRRELIAASGAAKRGLVRRLQALEARSLAMSLAAAQQHNNADVAECLLHARGLDLFGRKRGLDRELRQRLDQLRSRSRTLRAARRRLARDGEVPWFHYQSHFADVFAKGGFDLVVGNPPWLRSEDIPLPIRRRLVGRYRWWRTTGPGFGNKPDLAVAFLERSLELAAPGGVLAMLVPAKIASVGYAAAARHSLASTTTLNAVVDLTQEAGSQFDATVYPMALVVTKAVPARLHRVRTRLSLSRNQGPRQYVLAGGGPWILVRDRLRDALAMLQGDHPRVGETFLCQLGLKTGANRVFLNPPEGLEPEVLRWAVRGRDVTPFRCTARARLLWTHDAAGHVRRELPVHCTAYLADHHAALRSRRDYTGGPPWTVYRVRAATATHRVVWADLARRLAAAALTTPSDQQRIPLNSCYVAAAQNAPTAECLAACLNSTWSRAAARLAAVPAAGGFSRFNARTVSLLPLPSSAGKDPELLRLAREGRAGAPVQGQLDELMARHFGLSGDAQNALRTVVDSAAGYRR
ncbi:MAG: hypothetical protein H0T58_06890 [Gemmatimonadales bacterium]|nr:hypothetical protein [Gemmatimonadales bacterium]